MMRWDDAGRRITCLFVTRTSFEYRMKIELESHDVTSPLLSSETIAGAEKCVDARTCTAKQEAHRDVVDEEVRAATAWPMIRPARTEVDEDVARVAEVLVAEEMARGATA